MIEFDDYLSGEAEKDFSTDPEPLRKTGCYSDLECPIQKSADGKTDAT